MSEERHIPGPPSELADTLNHWRELFQRKHAEDFEALKGLDGMEEPIFSFLVDYADIDQDDLLSLRFNEFPERTLEQANEVLRSMCSEHTDVRCVLRPILFPDEKLKTVSSLRMRNRGELVSLIVKIQDVGPRLGYLKRPCIPAKPAEIERKFRNVLLENESDQQDHVGFVWKTHNEPWERTYRTASTDVLKHSYN